MKHVITSPLSLGNAIRTARKQAGITQSELGAQVGMDQATISGVERGKPGTRFDTILHLLSVLNLSIEIGPRGKTNSKQEEW